MSLFRVKDKAGYFWDAVAISDRTVLFVSTDGMQWRVESFNDIASGKYEMVV